MEVLMADKNRNKEPDANRDPITDEPGSHPIGTATGGTGGALAGAGFQIGSHHRDEQHASQKNDRPAETADAFEYLLQGRHLWIRWTSPAC